MPRYSIPTLETRTFHTTCWVEANDPEDAVRRLREGDIDKQTTPKPQGEIKREPIGAPSPVDLVRSQRAQRPSMPALPRPTRTEGLFDDYTPP